MKKTIILGFVLSCLYCFSQDTTEFEFAQVYYKEAWRIINRKGEFVLNQKFGVDSYENLCFSDGLVVSFEKGKYGFTDFSNKQVIPNKYNYASCFFGGYAPVVCENKWGIIDTHDKFIVEPLYDFTGQFLSYGLAGIIKDDKIAFVDTTGKIVIPFKYYWRSHLFTLPSSPFFSEGLLAVADGYNLEKHRFGKVGYINIKGEMVIPAIYDRAGFFINGKASVTLDGVDKVIDTFGNIVFDLKTNKYQLMYFNDNYSFIYTKDGKRGLVDKSGSIILEPKYNSVDFFSEGIAAVQIESTLDGVVSAFVDTTGKFLFDKKFGFIKDFHEGKAAVEINDKWGYIDRNDDVIIQPKYIEAYEFIEGVAVVGIKKGKKIKYGYINSKGEFLLQPIYNDAREFKFGLAPVKIGDKYGFIDEKGNIIIKPKFDNAFGFQREVIEKVK